MYKKMLEHTKLLRDMVANPTKHGIDTREIREHIRAENEQHSMNALIEWVLDIEPRNYE